MHKHHVKQEAKFVVKSKHYGRCWRNFRKCLENYKTLMARGFFKKNDAWMLSTTVPILPFLKKEVAKHVIVLYLFLLNYMKLNTS